MKYCASIHLIIFGFLFSYLGAMETHFDIEKAAEQGNAPAIISMASKKSLQCKFDEALALLQRYQIRVAQDNACFIDGFYGKKALLEIQRIFSNEQHNAFQLYIENFPIEKANNLFKKQLDWVEGKMKYEASFPEPVWLGTYCANEKKENLFIEPEQWSARRALVLQKFRSKLS